MNSNLNSITNFEEFYALMDDDHELITSTLKIIAQELPQYMADLLMYSSEKNWEKVQEVAHKMAPSFTLIGAHEVEKTLRKIEADAEAHAYYENIEQQILQVKESFMQIMDVLKKKLADLKWEASH